MIIYILEVLYINILESICSDKCCHRIHQPKFLKFNWNLIHSNHFNTKENTAQRQNCTVTSQVCCALPRDKGLPLISVNSWGNGTERDRKNWWVTTWKSMVKLKITFRSRRCGKELEIKFSKRDCEELFWGSQKQLHKKIINVTIKTGTCVALEYKINIIIWWYSC